MQLFGDFGGRANYKELHILIINLLRKILNYYPIIVFEEKYVLLYKMIFLFKII